MIQIRKSEIAFEDGFVLVSAQIRRSEESEILWYKFPERFSKFLSLENMDAFVIGILFLGIKSGEDIEVEGMISARLNYNLKHYLIPALCLANPTYKKITVTATGLNNRDLNEFNDAGTGMSCGIDSFATYFDHKEENSPFKINYFTFFNVGSHLDYGGERSRHIFQKRFQEVEDFAKKEGVEVISVDSNLSEILKMNFQQTHSLRSISCVLHLQKLFRNYYYSSAYRFDHFKINDRDTSDYDILNLQMLSTESVNFYASAAQYSRVERTLLIAEYPETYLKLDVCTDPPQNSDYINCSVCYKCLRTQMTLEVADKLHLFNKVFDISKYEKIKNKYLGGLLVKPKKSTLDNELLHFIEAKNYRFSSIIYFYSLEYLLKLQKKKLRNFFIQEIKVIPQLQWKKRILKD